MRILLNSRCVRWSGSRATSAQFLLKINKWQATVEHIAIEGRCYVINCAPYIERADYPHDLCWQHEVDALPDVVYRGGSSIVDPFGHNVVGPLWDQPGILYADLDMQLVPAAKWEFDPVGHYARPDVLRLEVNDI